MGGCVPGHTLKASGCINELFHPIVALIQLLQLGGHFQCVLQGNVGRGRNQLRNSIGFRIAEVERTAYIPDGTPGSHSTKGDNLGNMVSTIFPHHIVDDLLPAFLAEIGIKIRHTDPLRVQKPLKDQRILHGINFRDVQTIRSYGGRAGATAGSHRDPLLLCVANEIPDNQIVVYIPHAGDDINLIFQSVTIALGRVRVTLMKTVDAELPKIFLVGISLRNRERGQMVLMEGKFQITPLGDFPRIGKGFFTAREKLPQLLFAFQIKFVRGKAHPVGIIYGFAGLDAQQHILHGRILFAQIMGIVGDDHGDTQLPGKPLDSLIHRPLFRNAVILKFQIKMILSEYGGHFLRIAFGSLVILHQQCLRYSTPKAGRQGN